MTRSIGNGNPENTKRIEQGVGAVSDEHRVVGIEHHEVGGRAGRQPGFALSAGLGATRQHPAEEFLPHVKFRDGSDVPGFRAETLSVFEPNGVPRRG